VKEFRGFRLHDWRSSETVICTSAAKAGKLTSLTAGLKARSTLSLRSVAQGRLCSTLALQAISLLRCAVLQKTERGSTGTQLTNFLNSQFFSFRHARLRPARLPERIFARVIKHVALLEQVGIFDPQTITRLHTRSSGRMGRVCVNAWFSKMTATKVIRKLGFFNFWQLGG